MTERWELRVMDAINGAWTLTGISAFKVEEVGREESRGAGFCIFFARCVCHEERMWFRRHIGHEEIMDDKTDGEVAVEALMIAHQLERLHQKANT